MNHTYVTVGILLATVTMMTTPAVAGMSERAMDTNMQQEMMDQRGMLNASPTGMLKGAKDHHASGTVMLVTSGANGSVLRIDHMKVDKVPDGRVYLAKGGNYTTGVELGKLTRFTGTVEFAIPAGVTPSDYDSVVIWCKKFDVEIGRAMLAAAGSMEPSTGNPRM